LEQVKVAKKEIRGLTLRTCNADEMNPQRAKIPAHVAYVDANVHIDYAAGARAYSVYFNYASDVNGEFDVLMGSDQVAEAKAPLQSVTIEPGSYLKFTAQGDFPAAVIEAWQSVWRYFSAEECEHTRAYTTDFEHYENANTVSVYIALREA